LLKWPEATTYCRSFEEVQRALFPKFDLSKENTSTDADKHLLRRRRPTSGCDNLAIHS